MLKWGDAATQWPASPLPPLQEEFLRGNLPYEQVVSCFIIYKKTSQNISEKSSEIFYQKKEVKNALQTRL